MREQQVPYDPGLADVRSMPSDRSSMQACTNNGLPGPCNQARCTMPGNESGARGESGAVADLQPVNPRNAS
jgi:hypothetical protein